MAVKRIRLNALPPERQEQLIYLYLQLLRDERATTTCNEAAALYGYTHQTLRHYCCRGRIKARGHGQRLRITHAAMRAYIKGKKLPGRPRKALKNQQTRII